MARKLLRLPEKKPTAAHSMRKVKPVEESIDVGCPFQLKIRVADEKTLNVEGRKSYVIVFVVFVTWKMACPICLARKLEAGSKTNPCCLGFFRRLSFTPMLWVSTLMQYAIIRG